MVWAGFPQRRWSELPADEPVLLLSLEDHYEPGEKPYYELLDDTREAVIALRQINVSREGFWRRSWDGVRDASVFDQDPVTAAEVARSLYQQILRRLYVT